MPDPHSWQAIGWIAVAIFALAGGLNQVIRVVDRFKGHPPAETLKLSADELARRVAVLERDAKEAMERRRAMHARIDGVKSSVQDEVKKDMGDIYERLNTLSASVAGLERDNENQTRHLTHIESKLDRLIERTHS